MRKLKAIAISDVHLNIWKAFNEGNRRLVVSDNFLEEVIKISDKEKIPILFSGDMFHTPGALPNGLLEYYTAFFKNMVLKYPYATILGISGNHDIVGDSRKGKKYTSHYVSLCNTFPNLFKCLDYTSVFINNMVVSGIPYIKHNNGFKEALEEREKSLDKGFLNILLIHTNLYGAKDPSGYEIDEVPNIPRNLGKFFKPWDLVLCGHIHKHDQLWEGKVYMVGAPYQQRSSDSGERMGYLEVYSDGSVKRKYYDAPEFKYYNEGEPVPDDGNFWIEVPKELEIEREESGDFTNINNKAILAEEYFKVKGITNDRRLNLLIKTLNETEL